MVVRWEREMQGSRRVIRRLLVLADPDTRGTTTIGVSGDGAWEMPRLWTSGGPRG